MALRPITRLNRLPSRSFFLLGIRGVGKSTWIQRQLPEARRFDLLDEALFEDLRASRSRFARELRRVPPASWVVVDGIHRLPRLVKDVRRFIAERELRFALLGSNQRRVGTYLMAFLSYHVLWQEMFPLTPEELGEAFDLERTLEIGALPLVLDSDAPEDTLRAYVQLYLSEEIQGEALVRNPPAFARFLPIAAQFHGEVINVAGIAREAAVARTTVNRYLEILESTRLALHLPAYEARLRVRERQRPKLYWVDPGVVRAVKQARGPAAPEEAGALLEGWVHTLLQTYMAERELGDSLRYWAPAGSRRVEVDFLLRRGSEFCALEVKPARRFNSQHLAGLRAIAGLPELRRRVLIYRGDRTLRTEDGIDVWPVATFLDALAAGELWP